MPKTETIAATLSALANIDSGCVRLSLDESIYPEAVHSAIDNDGLGQVRLAIEPRDAVAPEVVIAVLDGALSREAIGECLNRMLARAVRVRL